MPILVWERRKVSTMSEENFLGPYPPKRKWQVWIGIHGVEFGDRKTRESHTQIGLFWIALVGWGLYKLISAAIKLNALAGKL